jgi:Flp pilus assembly pilin Flp
LVREERGQNTVEWAGVLVVVAVLIAGVVTVMPRISKLLSHDIVCTVEKIFSQNSCSAPGGPVYPLSTDTKSFGYNGRVMVVDGSHQYTFTITRYSNGTATVTLQNTASGGVSLEAGVSAQLGSYGFSATASAGVGAFGQGSYTWTFQHVQQANDLWNKLSTPGGLSLGVDDTLGPIGSFFTGSKEPGAGSLPKQNLTSQGVGGGVNASANAQAGADIPGLGSANVSANVAASAGVATITSGPQKGDIVVDYSLTASAGGSLQTDLLGGHSDSANGSGAGTVTVTYSPSGKPLTVDIDHTLQGGYDVGGTSSSSSSTTGVAGKAPASGGGSTEGGTSGSGTASASGAGSGGDDSGGDDDTGEGSSFGLTKSSSSSSATGTDVNGTLNVQQDPAAASAVDGLLAGDPADLATLLSDMNSSGTETVTQFTSSNSSSGISGSASVGVGFGAGTNSSKTSTKDQPPKQRVDGGAWETE